MSIALVAAVSLLVLALTGLAVVAVCLRATRARLDAVLVEREIGRDDERRFRSLVQHSSDLILLLDRSGEIRYASAAARETIGVDAASLVGAHVADLAHPEDRLKVQALLAECLDNTRAAPSTDFRIHRAGGPHWTHVEAVATNRVDDPDVGAVMLSLRDTTRRKWAEEALRAAERRYRSLVEQIPLVTYLDNVDERSSAIFMSPQIVPLLGYSTEEWLSDRDLFVKLLHPDDRERVLAEIAAAHEVGAFTSEYRLVGRDGRVVWFHDQSTTIVDDDGAPLYAQGYMLDITAERENGNGAAQHERDTLSRADAP